MPDPTSAAPAQPTATPAAPAPATASAPAVPAPAAAAPAAAAPAAPATETLITTPEGGTQGTPGKPTEAAPADIKIAVPEGFTADAKQIEQFTAFAKEKGITQEAAQGLFNQYVSNVQAMHKAAETQRAEMITNWAEESRKEFGTTFDQTVADAKRALNRFGSPALNKILTETGLGNNKDVIKAFAEVGKRVAEDKLPSGDTAPVSSEMTEQDRLKALYPSMFAAPQQ